MQLARDFCLHSARAVSGEMPREVYFLTQAKSAASSALTDEVKIAVKENNDATANVPNFILQDIRSFIMELL